MVSSFDMFDTLATRRWFYPEDLMLAVGSALSEMGMWTKTPQEFLIQRKRAELRIRRRSQSGEVTLEEIYREMFGDSAEQIAGVRIEFEEELRSTRPIARNVAALVESNPAQTIVVSDTYLGAPRLVQLLARCGLDLAENQIYASCDWGASKQSGGLFRLVSKERGIVPVSHLGDSRRADFDMAKSAQWAPQLYVGGGPTRYEVTLRGPRRRRILARSLVAGAARVSRLARHYSDRTSQTLWNTGTDVIAPLLLGYVCWCLVEAQTRGIKHLLFGARDGQVLHAIAKKLVDAGLFELRVDYFAVSRRATFLADPDLNSNIAPTWLIEEVAGKPLGTVYAWLGLPCPAEDLAILVPSAPSAVRGWMLSAAGVRLREAFSLRGRSSNSAFVSYVRNMGVGNHGPVGFVDLGWRGRIQTVLSRAFRHADIQPSVFGFYLALNRPTPNDASSPRAAFLRNLGALNGDLIELFCMADHGTLLSYDESQPDNCKYGIVAGDWQVETAEILRDANLAFVDELLQATKYIDLTSSGTVVLLRAVALHNLHLFFSGPTAVEAAAWAQISHDPATTVGAAYPIARPAHPLACVLSQLTQKWPSWLLRTRQTIAWPAGALALSRIRAKPFDVAALKLAYAVKHYASIFRSWV